MSIDVVGAIMFAVAVGIIVGWLYLWWLKR